MLTVSFCTYTQPSMHRKFSFRIFEGLGNWSRVGENKGKKLILLAIIYKALNCSAQVKRHEYLSSVNGERQDHHFSVQNEKGK